MFRRTPFASKCAHGRNVRLKALLLRTIRPRGQLDQRMQRHLHPGTLLLRHVHVIRVDTPQHGLVRHDDDILTALQLHDDRLKPDNNVAIRLSTPVAIIVFIVISRFEIFGVLVRNLLVRETVADARVQFVQGFPFELVVAFWGCVEKSSCLYCAFKGGGPDCKLAVVTDGGCDKVGKRTGVEFTAIRNISVAADLAGKIEFGFAVLDDCQQKDRVLGRR